MLNHKLRTFSLARSLCFYFITIFVATNSPAFGGIDLAKYQRIGVGQYGIVYDYGEGKALKVAKEIANNDNLRAEYENFMKLQDSKAVPQVFGLAALDDGRLALIMEKGKKSLFDAIKDGDDLSSIDFIETTKRMMAFKRVLDGQGISYADIKPANLLIMHNGVIKAIDIDATTSPAYIGTFGEKMAKTLLEGVVKKTPLFYFNLGSRRWPANTHYETYRAKVVYKKLTGSEDARNINSLESLFDKLPKNDWSKIFDRRDYSKSHYSLEEDLSFIADFMGGKESDKEEYKEEYKETLNRLRDDFSSFNIPFKGRKNEILDNEQKEAFLEIMKSESVPRELQDILTKLYELKD